MILPIIFIGITHIFHGNTSSTSYASCHPQNQNAIWTWSPQLDCLQSLGKPSIMSMLGHGSTGKANAYKTQLDETPITLAHSFTNAELIQIWQTGTCHPHINQTKYVYIQTQPSVLSCFALHFLSGPGKLESCPSIRRCGAMRTPDWSVETTWYLLGTFLGLLGRPLENGP